MKHLLKIFLVIWPSILFSQVELVKDINAAGAAFESNENLVVFNGKIIFPANDGNVGNELWVSDGTTAGTTLLKDINTGVGGSFVLYLTAVQDRLYFRATTDTEGAELYYTDGTNAGTQLNIDLISGTTGSSPANFYTANGNLYYIANDPSQSGRELFVTNTSVIANSVTAFPADNVSSFNAAPINDSLIYVPASVGGADPFGIEPYLTDGETNSLIKDLNSGSKSSIIINSTDVNGEVYFFADTVLDPFITNYDLWKTDGTSANTIGIREMPEIDSGIPPGLLTPVGNGLIFFGAQEVGYGTELWVTDGTAPGTQMVKAINPSDAFAGSQINSMTSAGDIIYFAATDGTNGMELWRSDGTEAGTFLVKDINPVSGSSLLMANNQMIWFNNKLYFAADDGSAGRELWVSDGTAGGTVMVADINPGATGSDPAQFAAYNGSLYFIATDATNGRELRKYTPAVANTVSGTITDVDGGQTLEGVNIENITQAFSTLSAADGNYTIEANVGDTLVYTLNNYEPDSVFVEEAISIYDLAMQYNPCYGVFCPLGEVCIDGLCYAITEGTVTHASTGAALENVAVNNITRSESTVTNAQGLYQIKAVPDDSLVFVLEGYYSDTIKVVSGTLVYNTTLIPIEPCTGISCPLGEVCVDGVCGDPCDFTQCPKGQICEAGNCVSQDPCEGIYCPLGEVCFEGSCFAASQGGKVQDQLDNPLDSVLIYHIESQDTLYSDAGGNYYINQPGNYRFQKLGYSPKTLNLSQGILNVVLSGLACENISCPDNQVCYGGSCYDPFNSFTASFIVKDVSNGQILPNIEVSPLNDFQRKVITDSNGEVTLNIAYPTDIIFRDPNNSYEEVIITPTSQLQEVLLTSTCAGVNCPLGQVCFQGSCYNPASGIYSGYVFDTDSLPLPNVYVSNGNNEVITSSNGYFEIAVTDFPDSAFITVSKTGYGSFEKQMYLNQLNEIYIFKDDQCYNVFCPLGEVCYEGSCYTAPNYSNASSSCEGIVCPLGQVCFDGSCYDPCSDVVDLCTDSLVGTCDNVTCPLGQVCDNGVCYDPCTGGVSGDQCYSGSNDPCENINPPAGYICVNGVVVPDCSQNLLACTTSSICGVITCPPGDVCFTCNDLSGVNSSGTSSIFGQLSLTDIGQGGRLAASQNENVFIFLIDQETGRKTKIAKSNSTGEFLMENVPAGTYQIFITTKGYFKEDMILDVNSFENIQLAFTSSNRFINMQQARVTGIEDFLQGVSLSWFPAPNNGETFYIKQRDITQLKIFTIQGYEVNMNWILENTGKGSTLHLKTPLSTGIYLFNWKTDGADKVNTQIIVVTR